MTLLLEPLPAHDVELDVGIDEAAARRDLRAQIARLEARGVMTPAAASGPRTPAGPRVLSLGELAAIRDALITRPKPSSGHFGSYSDLNCPLDVRIRAQEGARVRFERLVADPGAHRHERISLAELGKPGCGSYRVKPRLGLVGRFAGWWEITLSSGCP